MTDSQGDKTFRDMLTSDTFHYGIELISSRGFPPMGEDWVPIGEEWRLLRDAEALAVDPHFSWVSVTDNPGGNPMIPADSIAHFLKEKGREVVIHLSCKDLNRNGLESAAWRAAAEEVDNILALTGDYPSSGFGEGAAPVFDLDSVGLITLLQAMNNGLELKGRQGKTSALHKTNFFTGCAVSPFKRHEREYLPQLLKLARKIRSGARWVIPQLGYDMRKLQELQLFLNWVQLDVPLVGNVYLLSKFVAGMFNRNQIPGCVVSDALLEEVNKQAKSQDKGRAYFNELAAKQLAVFKGLGYSAGYLAGTATPEVFASIIDLVESYGEDDWKDFARELQYPVQDEFYLFERDPETGLSHPEVMNEEYVKSLLGPEATSNVSFTYRLSRKVHDAAFKRGNGLYENFKSLYKTIDGEEGTVKNLTAKALYRIEKASKQLLYGCQDCGDCSLPDIAYLCPRSSCSKTGRNGPCGGSHDGRCELDDKECIWARAYERMKYYGESQQMLDGAPVIANPKLKGTSAWANTFLDRDHHAPDQTEVQPLVIKPLPTKKKSKQ